MEVGLKKIIADYVLVYKGIKLAVVEAKSDDLGVGEGIEGIPIDPVVYNQKLDESVEVFSVIHIKELSELMFLIKLLH